MKLEARFQRAPTDEEMATELDISVEDFQDALLQISNSTIVALDELWSVSDSTGDQVSLLDTLPDRGAPDPAAARRPVRAARPHRRRDRRAARAREARRRALLLREPDPARDRRGARGHRVARVAAAHQGRAAPAVQARRRAGLGGSGACALPPGRMRPGYGAAHAPTPRDGAHARLRIQLDKVAVSAVEREETRHAQGRGSHPQRGPRRPPRQW